MAESTRIGGRGPEDTGRGPEDTGLVVRQTFERTLAAGEIVFDEGEEGDSLFVIQAGQVELTRYSSGEERLLARHGPGDFFGEMSVLLGRPRNARATAAAETRLLLLDANTLEAMCVEQPEIAIRLIQRLAARGIELEQRLAALGVDDLLRPVVRVLVRRAEPYEAGARVETSLRELAGEAGLSLLEAHRALGQLVERRLLKLVDDVLEVADLEALSACLDGDAPSA